MSRVDVGTEFCLRHGWVVIVERAEIVPGVYVPLCEFCREG